MTATAARNARLALAMGIDESAWQPRCVAESHHLDSDSVGGGWCYDCSRMAQDGERVPPSFDVDHNAKAKLLAWLATDRARWNRFLYALMDVVERPEMDEDWRMYAKVFILASPVQIAAAADAAIRGGAAI